MTAEFYQDPRSIDGEGNWHLYRLTEQEQSFNYIEQGWYEIRERLHKICRELTTVVQAGGWQGVYPRLFGRLFQEVYTFEPDLRNWQCLEQNCPQPNIRKFCAALSDRIEELDLDLTATTGQHRVQRSETPVRAYTGVEVLEQRRVPAMTIDSLGLAHCSLIQLDLEGWEYHALLGADETIRRFKPGIIVERSIYDENTLRVHDLLVKTHRYRLVDRTEMDRYYSAY